jgi:protein-S-isoprenylcysteine O-methyltransferase Ste14
VLSILEDRELAAHFGEEYEEYARGVPRLFPN